jgi:uncharacterized protein HemX
MDAPQPRADPAPPRLHRGKRGSGAARADSARRELKERERMVEQRSIALTRAQRALRLLGLAVAAVATLAVGFGWYVFHVQQREFAAQAREVQIKENLVLNIEAEFRRHDQLNRSIRAAGHLFKCATSD